MTVDGVACVPVTVRAAVGARFVASPKLESTFQIPLSGAVASEQQFGIHPQIALASELTKRPVAVIPAAVPGPAAATEMNPKSVPSEMFTASARSGASAAPSVVTTATTPTAAMAPQIWAVTSR
jgi:hypothetical protein